MDRYDAFLSFSFKDKDVVENVADELKDKYGISCWLCLDRISEGQSYKDKIPEAIDNSSVMVVFVSKDSIASTEVPKEVGMALKSDKTVIPFRLDDAKYQGRLRYDLEDVNFIDATKDPFEERIKDLAKAICFAASKPLETNAHFKKTVIRNTPTKKPQFSKKLIPAVAVLLVTTIVIGVFSLFDFGGNISHIITPHISEYELVETLTENNEGAGTTKANLYFDNTQSMYGYICDDTNMTSNFTIACQDLANIIEGYNSFSINTLCPNEADFLKWEEIGASGFKQFKKKDFYTFWNTSHSGSFDRANGQYGPLQTLFNDSSTPVNFDELNIFITDLTEQELNNKILAEKINDIVLEREDHSVALYCIKSNFIGFASVSVSGISDSGMINNDNFNGVRPFYCLIVGPTMEVASMCDSIDETLTDSGLAENSDYFSAKILSKRGLQYTPITDAEYKVFSDLYVDEENKYHDYNQYPAGVNFENTNLNFNVTPIHYDQIFVKDVGALGGLYYTYDVDAGSIEKSTFGNAAINFIIPLSNLSDGSPANYVNYQLTKDMIKVYGYSDEWEEIDFQSLFNSSSPYMQEPVCEFWDNGETIDRVKDFATNEVLEHEEYPSDKIALYTVENESGALRVKFAFNNIDELAEKYKLITIVCNINAKKELDTNIPQWISEFNLSNSTESSLNNVEIYEKTADLDDFYKFLIGDMSSASARENFESKMTKNISDIVVTVSLDY